MKKLTIIFIRDDKNNPVQIRIPSILPALLFAAFCFVTFGLGILGFHYSNLVNSDIKNRKILLENQKLRGEFAVLSTQLGIVKNSLAELKTVGEKINTLINFNAENIAKKTGVEHQVNFPNSNNKVKQLSSSLPWGIDISKLEIKTLLSSTTNIKQTANEQLLYLKDLISKLSHKKNYFYSVPSFLPTKGWLASGFGYRISPFTGKKSFHKGLDIAASVGTPIYAPASGVVVFSGKKSGFGNFVMIAHSSHGIVTSYGHNSENLVRVGQAVVRGEQIANVGNTGNSTGSHLHYEVHVNGRAVNPLKFIITPLSKVALK